MIHDGCFVHLRKKAATSIRESNISLHKGYQPKCWPDFFLSYRPTLSRQYSQRRPSSAPAPSSPIEQTDRRSGQQAVSSGVKRDAHAAELPDKGEQGGGFQQVEGLTTVDAEEIPCEFSVEDDFMIDENTEGIKEETFKAILAGKKKELDAMEVFGIFDVCEDLPRHAKVITTRWENVPKGDKWRCRFVAREFRHDDPEMKGLYTSGSTTATGTLVDMHAVDPVPRCRKCVLPC